ncbi:delta and Notch-like epidermal growth factor-related receptor isoform X1 [Rhipicephalus sanguineus]|uniref:EGF-like domain-containing protein n=1 Tax=Rhipicephalus sanguineus TaxID=34632 RepID=A0A9D4Q1F8_RHISA|nr:delta and Notch-like epidermal growth factor-related receptor isoform X1 [Rhipicephalus sanguineus]KAH7962646.1 hypothetical protein HPB52_017292 [Rhipicephalus sanguineus]
MAASRRAVCSLLLLLATAQAAPGRSPMPGSVFIANPTSGTPLSTSAAGVDCADPSLPRWRNLPKTHRLVLSAANVACTPDSEANRTQEDTPRTTLSLSIQSMDDIQLNLSEEWLPVSGNATDPRLALQSLQGGYGQQPCRRDEALLLWEKPYHAPGLTISPEILTPGSHALSVHLWGSAWLLNVSVAGHECSRTAEEAATGSLEAPCSAGGGACVLEPGAASYACRCCPGLSGRFCEERDGCFHKPCLNQGFCVDIAEGLSGSLFQCLCPHGYRGRRCEEPLSACELHPCPQGTHCVQTTDEVTNRSCVADTSTILPITAQQQPGQAQLQQQPSNEQETTQQQEPVQPKLQPTRQPDQWKTQQSQQDTQRPQLQQPDHKQLQEETTPTELPLKTEQPLGEQTLQPGTQQQVIEAQKQQQGQVKQQTQKPGAAEQTDKSEQQTDKPPEQHDDRQPQPSQLVQVQKPQQQVLEEQQELQGESNTTTTISSTSTASPAPTATEPTRNQSGGSACGARPCVHGKCEDLPAGSGGFRCYCLPGYGGDLCEFEYDECDSGPCAHGAQCEDLVAGFRCHCGPGYAGRRCEIKVDLCRPNPCPPPAQCLDRGNNYSCLCRHDGPGCTQRYDPCFPNPCQNGGSCWPSLDSFYCSCARGFTGDTCELNAAGGGSQLPPSAPADAMARTQGRPTDQLHNIYIAAATLAGACLIVLAVVSVCHCRVHQSYRGCVRRLGRSCAQLKQRTLEDPDKSWLNPDGSVSEANPEWLSAASAGLHAPLIIR